MDDLIKLNAKKRFEIINKSKNEADILIYADIGESFWGDSISAKDVSDRLNDLPDSINQINLRINSRGGSVFDGYSIYNRLKYFNANVTTYIDGLAASAASVVALAGDEIIMGEGAQFMIHKPMTMTYGDSFDHDKSIVLLDEIEEQLINIYRKKTNRDKTEIRQWISDETWFNAEEAIEAGFADKTMEQDESFDVAAWVDNCKWFSNKPNIEKNKYQKNQINKLNQKVKGFLARK